MHQFMTLRRKTSNHEILQGNSIKARKKRDVPTLKMPNLSERNVADVAFEAFFTGVQINMIS